jgi:hypothetical protein
MRAGLERREQAPSRMQPSSTRRDVCSSTGYPATYRDSTLDRILDTACRGSRHVSGVALQRRAEHGLYTVLYLSCTVVYLAMPSDQTHGVWIDDAQLGSDQGRIVSLQTPRSSMGRL